MVIDLHNSVTYLLAGHRLQVEGSNEVKMLKSMAGFPVFETDGGDAEWHVVFGHEMELPESFVELYHVMFEEDVVESSFGKDAEGVYYFVMTPRTSGTTGPVLMRYDGGDTVQATQGGDPTMLRFALWMATGMLASDSKMVLIHSSTIVHQGRAVLFLGESGTGKSTHTRLWMEHIPDAHLLNDDSPILTVENGEAVVYGSPWSGKTHCYHQRRFPLAAAVRLSQAPYNSIHRLSTVEAFTSLHPSFPPALAQDDEFQDKMVDLLSDVLRTVPVFHLECLPDEAAAWTSHDAIFTSSK